MKTRTHIALMLLAVAFLFGMVAGLLGGVANVFASDAKPAAAVVQAAPAVPRTVAPAATPAAPAKKNAKVPAGFPKSVQVDASCTGSMLTRVVRGVQLMAEYGRLPGNYTVRIECAALGKDAEDGHFVPNRSGTDTVRINTDRGLALVDGTVVHELAHFLDYNWFGGVGGKAATAEREAKVQAFREAVVETKAWLNWSKCRNASSDVGFRSYCNYLLDDAELFARATMQYVAQKSGDKTLLYAVDVMSDNPRPAQGDGLAAFAQWGADDFKAVYSALARLVR